MSFPSLVAIKPNMELLEDHLSGAAVEYCLPFCASGPLGNLFSQSTPHPNSVCRILLNLYKPLTFIFCLKHLMNKTTKTNPFQFCRIIIPLLYPLCVLPSIKELVANMTYHQFKIEGTFTWAGECIHSSRSFPFLLHLC